MTSFILLVLFGAAYCHATPLQPRLVSANVTALAKSDNTIVDFVDKHGRVGLLWSSIGLAILTSLLQGMVTTLVAITEDQSMWTFRFRIAKFEHWWWTAISTMLSMSFALIGLSFLAGNGNDSIGVLVLSTATTIAIVRYAIPAWRNRYFIQNRWLAWTGPSRTAIDSKWDGSVGDAAHWRKLLKDSELKGGVPPSDDYGFALLGAPKDMIKEDPTAILNALKSTGPETRFDPKSDSPSAIYKDGSITNKAGRVSLLWGQKQGFLPRVSRAINSVPKPLFASRPYTIDGYNGEGLMLAMGILGRNKGLLPKELVYDFDDRLKFSRGIPRDDAGTTISTVLEEESSFKPRPNKVMRSYYRRAMEEQYGGLGKPFVEAATELALIILDCTAGALRAWLESGLEQQDMEVNGFMSRPAAFGQADSPVATLEELRTLYRAKEVSMIVSLNKFSLGKTKCRPDLHCFALLYLAESAVEYDGQTWRRGRGATEPAWWNQPWVKNRLSKERECFHGDWKDSAAWLLGLSDYPNDLDKHPRWPGIWYEPDTSLMKQKIN